MTKVVVASRNFTNDPNNVTHFHERLMNNVPLETTKISLF